MTRLAYGTAAERSAAAADVAAHLAGGGIIAYPTETVYGLGCALRPVALARLSAFKGDRPFLLLIRDAGDAAALRWTDGARRLAAAFWPGPLTLALDDPTGAFPSEVRGPDGAVAVRVSPHPAIPALLDAAGGPLTSTSANRPGAPPASEPSRLGEVEEGIEGLLVLDGGPLPPAEPSTIVRCGTGARILREGALPRKEIERVTELA
jgi:L-threonylcarbamoyladenylate synthase